MSSSRIHAIDHVHLQAPFGVDEALKWFYGDVAGLELLPLSAEKDTRLRFRSARLELRIDCRERPRIESVKCCVTLLVPSLPETVEMLDARRAVYEQITGLWSTDEQLAAYDPAGNRVRFKHEWPYQPL